MSKQYNTIILRIALLVCGAVFCLIGFAQDLMPRSYPEAEGLRSGAVKQFFDTLMHDQRTEIHSCIIVRNGKVVAEMYPKPWRKDYRHTMYSVSKTFTSLAVGMCIEEGLFDLDTPVHQLLGEYMPSKLTKWQSELRVRDLLTMQSGIPVDTKLRANEKEWLKGYLAKAPTVQPGTKWAYDSMLSYILSGIVQKTMGKSVMDLLEERLFLPMGIEDAKWEESPEGISCGGWGLYIRPEAMAMLGQLILDNGGWNGVQLVPSWWIGEMTKAHSVNSRYGLHMWQCQYPGWSEANGAYGQYIFIIPKANMVVSMTQCTASRAPLQEWIKELLVENCQAEPLNNDIQQGARYEYSLPMAMGEALSKIAAEPLHLELENNPMGWKGLTLVQKQDTLQLQVTDIQGRRYNINTRYRAWEETEYVGLPYHTPPPFEGMYKHLPQSWHVAGTYAWEKSDVLCLELHWVDWLTSAGVKIDFSSTPASLTFKLRDTGKVVSCKAI